MDSKLKQEVEFEISQAMAKFFKEHLGEETEAAIVQIAGDAIIIRFKGVLPPAERLLVKNQEGMKLIKELKEKLIERAKPLLEVIIKNLINAEVVDIHSSFDPGTGERIEIFTLNKNLEKSAKLSK